MSGMVTAVINTRAVAITGGSSGTIRVRDVATNREITSHLTPHGAYVEPLAGGQGSSVVLIRSGSGQPVQVWDFGTTQPARELATGAHAAAIAHLDGRTIAVTARSSELSVWDLTTGDQIGETVHFPGWIHAVTVDPQGRVIVCFGGTVAALAAT